MPPVSSVTATAVSAASARGSAAPWSGTRRSGRGWPGCRPPGTRPIRVGWSAHQAMRSSVPSDDWFEGELDDLEEARRRSGGLRRSSGRGLDRVVVTLRTSVRDSIWTVMVCSLLVTRLCLPLEARAPAAPSARERCPDFEAENTPGQVALAALSSTRPPHPPPEGTRTARHCPPRRFGRMPDWTLVNRSHVLAAIDEYDRLGSREFLSRYSFGRSSGVHPLARRPGVRLQGDPGRGLPPLHRTGRHPGRVQGWPERRRPGPRRTRLRHRGRRGGARARGAPPPGAAGQHASRRRDRARTPASKKPAKAPAKTARAKPIVVPVKLCPTCYTALPATGVCDYCD